MSKQSVIVTECSLCYICSPFGWISQLVHVTESLQGILGYFSWTRCHWTLHYNSCDWKPLAWQPTPQNMTTQLVAFSGSMRLPLVRRRSLCCWNLSLCCWAFCKPATLSPLLFPSMCQHSPLCRRLSVWTCPTVFNTWLASIMTANQSKSDTLWILKQPASLNSSIRHMYTLRGDWLCCANCKPAVYKRHMWSHFENWKKNMTKFNWALFRWCSL